MPLKKGKKKTKRSIVYTGNVPGTVTGIGNQ
jgi:hypothetical protein